MRLFKDGAVGYVGFETLQRDWPPNGPTYGTDAVGGGLHAGPYYDLSGEEVSRFLEFWIWFAAQRLQDRPRAALAVRRFHFGYERSRHEDRLIDHVIALEALLDDGTRQELSYRMSLRAAALLGKDLEGRRAIFSRMRFAYDARSAVAHGGHLEDVSRKRIGDVDLSTFLTSFEGDVRSTIIEYLRLAVDGEKVCDD